MTEQDKEKQSRLSDQLMKLGIAKFPLMVIPFILVIQHLPNEPVELWHLPLICAMGILVYVVSDVLVFTAMLVVLIPFYYRPRYPEKLFWETLLFAEVGHNVGRNLPRYMFWRAKYYRRVVRFCYKMGARQ